MIPFDKLGWAFHRFGAMIYNDTIRHSLCDFLQPLPQNASILDIGSGTGILCQFAAECREGLAFDAIDPAEGMMRYAPSFVTCHQGWAEALPFEDAQFDGVMMGETLHHIADVDRAFTEIQRVLKPGGRLFIYDFDPQKMMGKLIQKGEMLLGEPGNFFSPDALSTMLQDVGFKTVFFQDGYKYTLHATLR